MPLHKMPQSSVSSPEHNIAQQAAYLSNKYGGRGSRRGSGNRAAGVPFQDQQATGHRNSIDYAYPPPVREKESADEAGMRMIEENAIKGGHGVPLSSKHDKKIIGNIR